MSDAHRIAGVEIGGTKVAAVLWQDGAIVDEFRMPTSDPDTTFERLLPRLGRWWEASPFSALGVGSFGPVTLDPLAKDFGCIRTTPKPSWTGTEVVPRLARRFACPIGIDTDVNAAALAEYQWGHGRGADSLVYLTIGTGVGGGVLQGGRALHGRLHPELGHLLLRRQPGDDFAGAVCSTATVSRVFCQARPCGPGSRRTRPTCPPTTNAGTSSSQTLRLSSPSCSTVSPRTAF